ncbi:hypothetical protein ACHWQZ_G003836 [Mnemiopsis leidyi]
MIDPTFYYVKSACPDETADKSAANQVTTFCFWAPYIAWAFAYQNAAAIAVLSIDRFIAITFPFWYKVVITKTRARRITYITWASIISYLSLHFTLLQIGYTTVIWVPADGRCMYKVHSESAHISEWRFKIIEDSVFFLFPLAVTVVCYLIILVKLIKSRHQKDELAAIQKKPLCLTLFIVITSCIPWILYFIANYMHFRVKHVDVMIISYIFFYVSPIVNPIIFSTRSKTFHYVFWERFLKSKSRRQESYMRRYLKQKSSSSKSNTSSYSRRGNFLPPKSRDQISLKSKCEPSSALVLENTYKDQCV